MPNHCQNRVNITGTKKQLDKFIKKYCDKELNFSFNKIIPMPKSKKTLMEKFPEYYVDDSHTYGGKKDPTGIERHFDGYNGCLKYGGNKWDAMNCELKRLSNTEIEIGFDTAGHQPEKVIEKLSELEPKLSIQWHYYEAGCGFGGTYLNGFDIGFNGDLEEGATKKGFENRF